MNKTFKNLLVLIFIFFIAFFTFSIVKPLESFSLGEIKAVISNYFNKKNYQTSINLWYNQKTNERKRITEFIEIYFNDYLNRTCITLNVKDRKKFLKLIDKALDNVKSQKEKIDINIGELNIGISWKTGNREWIETDNNKIFLKVKTGIDKTNEMVISFTEAVIETDKYKPGILFLKEDSINELKKILSDENYDSLLKEAKPKL